MVNYCNCSKYKQNSKYPWSIGISWGRYHNGIACVCALENIFIVKLQILEQISPIKTIKITYIMKTLPKLKLLFPKILSSKKIKKTHRILEPESSVQNSSYATFLEVIVLEKSSCGKIFSFLLCSLQWKDRYLFSLWELALMNITCDNFFCSWNLMQSLQTERIFYRLEITT